MKIAICDDNKYFSAYIEEEINKESPQKIDYDIFASGDELIKYIYNSKDSPGYNIYFLDIEMPGKNGIETAAIIRKIDDNALIIFITEHKEYVYDVFEVLPFRFLIKPIKSEELKKILRQAIEHITTKSGLFFFKIERQNYQVPFQEIIYFESCKRKIKLYTDNICYEFYGKITDIITTLNPNLFCQIHASYIVNMEYIRSISDTYLSITDGNILSISKRFRKEVRDKHLKFMEWKCGD